jgi:tRNA1(Val) A37 N6-methylase TrmN6
VLFEGPDLLAFFLRKVKLPVKLVRIDVASEAYEKLQRNFAGNHLFL